MKGKVKFYMYNYIEQVLGEKNPMHLKETSVTPAWPNLFKTNDEAEKLSEEEVNQFHRSMAQLLFLSKIAIPDLQTTAAFVCTRVQDTNIDDARKLGRMM